MSDSTVRTAAATPLNQIRNLNNRIALLTLRRINRTHSQADLEEINRLQKRVDALHRQITAEKYQRPQ